MIFFKFRNWITSFGVYVGFKGAFINEVRCNSPRFSVISNPLDVVLDLTSDDSVFENLFNRKNLFIFVLFLLWRFFNFIIIIIFVVIFNLRIIIVVIVNDFNFILRFFNYILNRKRRKLLMLKYIPIYLYILLLWERISMLLMSKKYRHKFNL